MSDSNVDKQVLSAHLCTGEHVGETSSLNTVCFRCCDVCGVQTILPQRSADARVPVSITPLQACLSVALQLPLIVRGFLEAILHCSLGYKVLWCLNLLTIPDRLLRCPFEALVHPHILCLYTCGRNLWFPRAEPDEGGIGSTVVLMPACL